MYNNQLHSKIIPQSIINHIEELIENENTNIFPLEVFPSPFSKLIKECNTALNFPIDYTAVAVLTAVSTAIGKSAKLRVKNNWFEYASIFTAIIGNAGTNKSHPLQMAFNPLEKIDQQNIKKYELEYNAFAAYQSLSKKEKQEIPAVETPKLVKTILHNFTPEILHQRLTDNERGCAIVSEELATFLEGMNNYSKGDQTSIYLSIWSNKATSVDRVSKPVPLWLSSPFLNIIGSLQPRVLTKLFPASKSDNGFLQRFLFAFPDFAIKQPINDNELSEFTISNYYNWINNFINKNPILNSVDYNQPQPKLFSWSSDAKDFFYNWQAENTILVNQNENSLKGEILSKYDIHFPRLALILQIMENYDTNQVSLNTVKNTAKLCSYFINTSLKVLDILEKPITPEIFSQDKQDFYNDLPQNFTTAQAIEIGKKYKIEERPVKSFIAKKDIFKKISHGNYSKI